VFWDLLGQKELGRWRGSWMTHCLAFSPTNRTLAVNGEDEIFLLDTETQTALGAHSVDLKGLITDIAFSPDGQTLAASTNLSGSDDGPCIFGKWPPEGSWSIRSGSTRWPVIKVAFSPDGKTLASVGADGSLILWDFAARKPLGVLMKIPMR